MEALGRYSHDTIWLIRSVLDDGHTEGHLTGLQRDLCRLGNRLREPGGVHRLGTLLLAEPHGQHLAEPAFDRRLEGRMGLHPAADDDTVGFVRQPVEIDGHAAWRAPDLDHLHRCLDRRAGRFRRNPIAGKHLALAISGCTAVASHGRYDERLGPPGAQAGHDRGEDGRDLRDAAAAGGDGDARARLQTRPVPERVDCFSYRPANIVDSFPREALADARYPWE